MFAWLLYWLILDPLFYVSSSFAIGLDLHFDLLDIPIRVSTHVGECMIVEKVWSCLVTFLGEKHLCKFDYCRDG